MLMAQMLNDADPQDTLFNGKLYVSNQDDAFNTVLVTHLVEGVAVTGATTFKCASVRVRNENTGETITLQLVPTTLSGRTGATACRTGTRYYQNYFESCGS